MLELEGALENPQFNLLILWRGDTEAWRGNRICPESHSSAAVRSSPVQPQWVAHAPLPAQQAALGLHRHGEPHLLPGTLLQGAW